MDGRRTGGRRRGGVLLLALSLGCAGEHERGGVPWDPEASASSTGDESSVGASDEGGTGGDASCAPGETRTCLCPDGLHLGEATCRSDGEGFGACVCEDEDGSGAGADDEGGQETTDGGGMPAEVCYPGADNAWTTCVPLVYFDDPPEGYAYPEPYQGNPNYRKPIALIDVTMLDPGLALAPNFKLGEIAQPSKGAYAIVQPHAVASLQALRDAVGAIAVNSGYRSPAYNAQIGGATYSRHMYGDGFDLDPLEVGLDTLEVQCTSKGGMLVEYTTHVHCDFRFDPVDEAFYGPEPMGVVADPGFAAVVELEGDVATAPAEGFDEGEPVRRWTAFDEDGNVLLEATGPSFAVPDGTVRVEVNVGRVVVLERVL